MAYDESLAERLRDLLAETPEVTERKMFGGLAFLINGHMAVVASGQGGLMARVDPDDTEALEAEGDAEPVIMRGKEMRGWLRVSSEGVATDRVLQTWVTRSLRYVATLPPKS